MKSFSLGLGTILLLCISSNAYTHGGGLNSRGGHNSANGYHCHQGCGSDEGPTSEPKGLTDFRGPSIYEIAEAKKAKKAKAIKEREEARAEAREEARAEAREEAREEAAEERAERNKAFDEDSSSMGVFTFLLLLFGGIGGVVYFIVKKDNERGW